MDKRVKTTYGSIVSEALYNILEQTDDTQLKEDIKNNEDIIHSLTALDGLFELFLVNIKHAERKYRVDIIDWEQVEDLKKVVRL